MRSCSRHTHIRMLKGVGYSNEDDTPLLYETWFMIMLFIIWLSSLILLAVVQ